MLAPKMTQRLKTQYRYLPSPANLPMEKRKKKKTAGATAVVQSLQECGKHQAPKNSCREVEHDKDCHDYWKWSTKEKYNTQGIEAVMCHRKREWWGCRAQSSGLGFGAFGSIVKCDPLHAVCSEWRTIVFKDADGKKESTRALAAVGLLKTGCIVPGNCLISLQSFKHHQEITLESVDRKLTGKSEMQDSKEQYEEDKVRSENVLAALDIIVEDLTPLNNIQLESRVAVWIQECEKV